MFLVINQEENNMFDLFQKLELIKILHNAYIGNHVKYFADNILINYLLGKNYIKYSKLDANFYPIYFLTQEGFWELGVRY
jgi:hypothetical protein